MNLCIRNRIEYTPNQRCVYATSGSLYRRQAYPRDWFYFTYVRFGAPKSRAIH